MNGHGVRIAQFPPNPARIRDWPWRRERDGCKILRTLGWPYPIKRGRFLVQRRWGITRWRGGRTFRNTLLAVSLAAVSLLLVHDLLMAAEPAMNATPQNALSHSGSLSHSEPGDAEQPTHPAACSALREADMRPVSDREEILGGFLQPHVWQPVPDTSASRAPVAVFSQVPLCQRAMLQVWRL